MESKEKTSNKKNKKIISITSIILAIVLAFAGGFFTRHFLIPKEANLATELISYIEAYSYIFDENGQVIDLNEKDYANALINGLNDGYARYYTKSEYEKVLQKDSGNYSGFGVSINSQGEYPVITRVVSNSPAENAGILVGDKVVSATFKQDVVQFNSVDMGDFLDGVAIGEEVEFKIERAGQEIFIKVIKSNYKVTYVKYFDNQGQVLFDYESGQTSVLTDKKIEVDNDTALIRLEAFEGNVVYQFGKAMDYMEKTGRTKLILDLRDNGGGSMNDLLSVARHLIYNGGEKAVIAYTQNKSNGKSYYMHGPIKRESITDVVVLANEGTASASECLIGAMLCYEEKNFTYDRARLIIEKNSKGIARTYGKGIMQTTYLLSNGGAFKLTTARILWPDRFCIHGTGITTIPENEVSAGGEAIIRAREILS